MARTIEMRGALELILPEDIARNPHQYRGWRRPFRGVETSGYVISQKTKEANPRFLVPPYGEGFVPVEQVHDIYVLANEPEASQTDSGLTVIRKRDSHLKAPPHFSPDQPVWVRGKVREFNQKDAFYLHITQDPQTLPRASR